MFFPVQVNKAASAANKTMRITQGYTVQINKLKSSFGAFRSVLSRS